MSNTKPMGIKTVLCIIKTMLKSKNLWWNLFGLFVICLSADSIAKNYLHTATQKFFLRFVLITIWFLVHEYKSYKIVTK